MNCIICLVCRKINTILSLQNKLTQINAEIINTRIKTKPYVYNEASHVIWLSSVTGAKKCITFLKTKIYHFSYTLMWRKYFNTGMCLRRTYKLFLNRAYYFYSELKNSKMAVFWVVAPCSLVEVYQRFRGPCCLHHQGDESSALQPRRQTSSYSQPWEPQILLKNSSRLIFSRSQISNSFTWL
jgi:hypothetical protein